MVDEAGGVSVDEAHEALVFAAQPVVIGDQGLAQGWRKNLRQHRYLELGLMRRCQDWSGDPEGHVSRLMMV